MVTIHDVRKRSRLDQPSLPLSELLLELEYDLRLADEPEFVPRDLLDRSQIGLDPPDLRAQAPDLALQTRNLLVGTHPLFPQLIQSIQPRRRKDHDGHGNAGQHQNRDGEDPLQDERGRAHPPRVAQISQVGLDFDVFVAVFGYDARAGSDAWSGLKNTQRDWKDH